MKKARINLNKALTQDPFNQDALMQKGFMSFIQQDFSQAYDFFEKSQQSGFEAMKKTCRHFAHKKSFLTADEMIEAFRMMGKRKNLQYYMFDHDGKHNPQKSEHVKLIIYMLQSRNKSPDFTYQYDANLESLKLLNNANSIRLNSIKTRDIASFCFLRYLALKHLDLSHTRFSQFSDFKCLNLESLDHSACPIKRLTELPRNLKIKTLILHPSQKVLGQGKWPFEIVYKEHGE
jgi:hypothetical protein